ncbi:MAG: 2-C-methyl-D-erythritol 4-phosphate cytidylyltransferase [Bacteroidales bacterium]
MRKETIVVAGGTGKRMGASMPKQFLRLKGTIILMRTLSVFYNFDTSMKLILTLPEQEIQTWENLCKQETFNIPHTIVNGGETRFHSVKNGLKNVAGESLIAIHDGVRPLITRKTIREGFQQAQDKGSAIPYTDVNESMRYVVKGKNMPVNRERYKIIQTPQVFQSEIVINAYQTNYRKKFTDDASVVEHAGGKVTLFKGNPENIKITTKKDLAMAEVLLDFLENQSSE